MFLKKFLTLKSSMLSGKTYGFTLIELLVVVAIIGLLATVVSNAVGASRISARDARRLQNIRQIKTGMDLYFTNGGGYPPASLFVSGTQLLCDTTPIMIIPSDPVPSSVYTYTETGGIVPGCGRPDLTLGYLVQFTLEKDGITYTMNEDGQFNPSVPEL